MRKLIFLLSFPEHCHNLQLVSQKSSQSIELQRKLITMQLIISLSITRKYLTRKGKSRLKLVKKQTRTKSVILSKSTLIEHGDMTLKTLTSIFVFCRLTSFNLFIPLRKMRRQESQSTKAEQTQCCSSRSFQSRGRDRYADI